MNREPVFSLRRQQEAAQQRANVRRAASGQPLSLRSASTGAQIPGNFYGAQLGGRQILMGGTAPSGGAGGSRSSRGGGSQSTVNFGGQTLYEARLNGRRVFVPAAGSAPTVLEQRYAGRPNGAPPPGGGGGGSLQAPASRPPSSAPSVAPAVGMGAPPALTSSAESNRASAQRTMEQQYGARTPEAVPDLDPERTAKIEAWAAANKDRPNAANLVTWMRANRSGQKGVDGKNIVDRFLDKEEAEGRLPSAGAAGTLGYRQNMELQLPEQRPSLVQPPEQQPAVVQPPVAAPRTAQPGAGPSTEGMTADPRYAPDLEGRRRAAFLGASDSMAGLKAVRGVLGDELRNLGGDPAAGGPIPSIRFLEGEIAKRREAAAGVVPVEQLSQADQDVWKQMAFEGRPIGKVQRGRGPVPVGQLPENDQNVWNQMAFEGQPIAMVQQGRAIQPSGMPVAQAGATAVPVGQLSQADQDVWEQMAFEGRPITAVQHPLGLSAADQYSMPPERTAALQLLERTREEIKQRQRQWQPQ
jgi:hypothetical protein